MGMTILNALFSLFLCKEQQKNGGMHKIMQPPQQTKHEKGELQRFSLI
jgi:hypothetical protein